jgi:hypothetical protein
MSETGNIEAIGRLVAEPLFTWMKWSMRPCRDEDWKCELDEHKDKSTHPSDNVFKYFHPYLNKSIYVNTDLKSYKAGSITKTSIQSALTSLAMSVECAKVSSEWKDRFVEPNEHSPTDVIGMLFIYNHDDFFDKDFEKILRTIDVKKINVPVGVKLVVIGPHQIQNLCTIANDIKVLIAEEVIKDKNSYHFYYPEMTTNKPHGSEQEHAATIEVITGPWIIIKYIKKTSPDYGYIIYYNRKGDDINEFIYFLDTLSHYQLLLQGKEIHLRFTSKASKYAIKNFKDAKDEYLKIWGPDETRRKQLELIKYSTISEIHQKYNPTEIGMGVHL